MQNTNLPYPFNVAFERGDAIDYKCDYAKDHEYVKQLGYDPEPCPDCSYYAKGLKGFSLSSYGDWGTVFVRNTDDDSKKIFLDMYEQGVITLWRVSAYVNHIHYFYNENRWIKYDKELCEWHECDDPLKNDAK